MPGVMKAQAKKGCAHHMAKLVRPPPPVVVPGQVLRLLQHCDICLQGSTDSQSLRGQRAMSMAIQQPSLAKFVHCCV